MNTQQASPPIHGSNLPAALPRHVLLAVSGLSPQIVIETIYDLGWFHKLCADYNLHGIQFGRKNIHIMRDANERGMVDIRSIEDNRAERQRRRRLDALKVLA